MPAGICPQPGLDGTAHLVPPVRHAHSNISRKATFVTMPLYGQDGTNVRLRLRTASKMDHKYDCDRLPGAISDLARWSWNRPRVSSSTRR